MKIALFLFLLLVLISFANFAKADVCCTDTGVCAEAVCSAGTSCGALGMISCDCATYCCPYGPCGCCPSTTTTTTTTSTTTTTIPNCAYTNCDGYISYSSTGCKCGTATCYYGWCCASRNACFTTSQTDCQNYCVTTTTTSTTTTTTSTTTTTTSTTTPPTTTTIPTSCYFWGSPYGGACWYKMKDSSGNEIDWYDFRAPGVESCCAIKSSQDPHYKPAIDLFGNPTGYWCPSTETMWKRINSNSWPPGFSDGETCKVYYWCGVQLCSREGKWDPDDNACLIISGDGSTGACDFTYKKETTASGVKDRCGSSIAGDGACEQACGADGACDELNSGNYCGTAGRCTDYCQCCEASDSDGGINVLVKGTTTGTRLEGGSYTCQTQTDSCQDSNVVREWYVDYLRLLVYQDYDCRQRTDGKTRCADGRCVECTKDDDCKDASGNWRYDPSSHTKIVCDCPSGSCSLKRDKDYTCKALPKCDINEQCASDWCCDRDPAIASADQGSGTCSNNRTNPIYKNKYLCDPPGWSSEEASEKKQTLLDLLLNFFSSLFS